MQKFLILAVLLAAGVFLWIKWRTPRYSAGEAAPEITFNLADGGKVSLSDLRGNFVLLQFWGSWCGPCRAENPHIAALYDKYKDKGFQIVSVAIEQNPSAWRRAVERDGLAWKHHVVEPQDFSGPAAKLFNIRVIPTTFLISKEGLIMGVNLSSDRTDRILAEKLN